MPAQPQLTVLFLPESAYGPTNQCIGLGDLLVKRGHRVVFASESSWAGKLAPLGFEERGGGGGAGGGGPPSPRRPRPRGRPAPPSSGPTSSPSRPRSSASRRSSSWR